MNVIELLKKDHETVSGLFKNFESAKESKAGDQMERLAAQICEELTAHATVEEELFYPAVEARAGGEDEKAEDSVKEASEEHDLVKKLVAEIEGMTAQDDHFEAKVKVLKDVVEHHVEEEEGTLMPKAKKLLSSEELDEMGTRAETRKEALRAETAGSPALGTRASSPRQASSSRQGGKSTSSSSPRRSSSSTPRSSSSRSSSSRSSSSRSSSSRASRASRPARRGRARSSR